MGLARMTLEQLRQAQASGRAGLAAKREAGAYLRKDFLDAPEWDRLARRYGIRLPQWHVPPKFSKISMWLRKLGVTKTAYLEWSGGRDLSDCQRLNPDWPLRAEVGNLLEQIDAGLLQSSTLRVVCDEPEAEEEESPLPEAHVAMPDRRVKPRQLILEVA